MVLIISQKSGRRCKPVLVKWCDIQADIERAKPAVVSSGAAAATSGSAQKPIAIVDDETTSDDGDIHVHSSDSEPAESENEEDVPALLMNGAALNVGAQVNLQHDDLLDVLADAPRTRTFTASMVQRSAQTAPALSRTSAAEAPMTDDDWAVY
jgi:hypothetical protein